ncbi:hypothetical protein D9V32_14380 [Mycetocola tolaasinivorans]|uniref:DUF1648 domain-containing protein n=1 Tax=Mycetocola tolaasinivorans TaxID=76635 RepID=A0A3L7A0R2_9MICO|nr:hypothetical protein [Mycetocola tolaasinivorans]RLP73707.1 hypothetical protein D9V32_14380 [Mycetocola tolaasinivorans]
MRPIGRSLLSAVLILVPVIALILCRALWEGRFTAEVPSHWQGSGPTAFTPEDSLYTSMLWASGVSAVIALAAVFPWKMPTAALRWWVAIPASASAVTALMWITAAGSTLDLASASDARAGAGVLLVMAGIVYGAIPALVRPPARELERSESAPRESVTR